MARKSKSRTQSQQGPSDSAQAIRDSAHKIWLAGLGAFERARAEGPKMFEVLVEQGKGLAERARGAADQAMKSVRENASEASGRFDKFEQVLEERVSRSLNRLGVLTRGEVGDLSNQVRELADDVRAMMAANASAAVAGRSASRGGATKRRAAASASAAKRKVKRAVSSVKRGAKRRTKSAARKTPAKASRARS